MGLRGTLTRIWALRGTRPRMVRQQQSTAAYLFGAVCPQRGVAAGLALPAANTEAMQIHLEEIAAMVPAGKHALIICDRAAWHTTAKLDVPSNITLMPLPAYSPELNPVEMVWERLRDDFLACRCFDGYDELIDACCDAWNQFAEQSDRIRTLCSRRWAALSNAC